MEKDLVRQEQRRLVIGVGKMTEYTQWNTSYNSNKINSPFIRCKTCKLRARMFKTVGGIKMCNACAMKLYLKDKK